MSENNENKPLKNPELNIIKETLQQFIEIKNQIYVFLNDFKDNNTFKDVLNQTMNKLIENPNNKKAIEEIELEFAKNFNITNGDDVNMVKTYLNDAIPFFKQANNLENQLLSKISVLFGIPTSQSFLIYSLKPLLDKIRTSNDINEDDIRDVVKSLTKSVLLTQILSKLPMIPFAGPVLDAIIKGAGTSSSTGAALGVLNNFLLDAGVQENQLTSLKNMQQVAEDNPLVELYNILFTDKVDLDNFIRQLKEEVAKHFPLNQICPAPNPSDDQTQSGGKIKSLKNKKRSIDRTLNTINNTILNYLKRNSRRFQPFRKSIASRKVKRSF